MSDERERLTKPEDRAVSHEVLRGYLLGDLDEQSRSRIDEQLVVDDDFAQLVSIAESELIDDFAAGNLEAAESLKFKNVFLVTDARRKDLQLAAALRRTAAAQGYSDKAITARAAARRPWREHLRGLFDLRQAPLWAAAAAAVIVLVAGASWLASRRSGQNEPAVATRAPSTAVVPESAPASPAVDTGAVKESAPGNAAPDRLPSPAVASFVLFPGALRSSGGTTRIAVPRGERDIVRLMLVLETAAADTYLAELVNANGQTVAVRKNLKPRANGHTKVIFEIPARLIQTDDYQIKLQRKVDGQLESAGRYYFRALPE